MCVRDSVFAPGKVVMDGGGGDNRSAFPARVRLLDDLQPT